MYVLKAMPINKYVVNDILYISRTLCIDALEPRYAYDSAPKRALKTMKTMFVLQVEKDMMSLFMK